MNVATARKIITDNIQETVLVENSRRKWEGTRQVPVFIVDVCHLSSEEVVEILTATDVDRGVPFIFQMNPQVESKKTRGRSLQQARPQARGWDYVSKHGMIVLKFLHDNPRSPDYGTPIFKTYFLDQKHIDQMGA